MTNLAIYEAALTAVQQNPISSDEGTCATIATFLRDIYGGTESRRQHFFRTRTADRALGAVSSVDFDSVDEEAKTVEGVLSAWADGEGPPPQHLIESVVSYIEGWKRLAEKENILSKGRRAARQRGSGKGSAVDRFMSAIASAYGDAREDGRLPPKTQD